MKCPGCNGKLTEVHRSDVAVDVCSDCYGVWFDRGELEAYWSRVDTAPTFTTNASSSFERNSTSNRICPRCIATTLEMGSIKTFEAGLCSDCKGVWVSTHKGTGIQQPVVKADGEQGGYIIDFIGVVLDLIVGLG